MYQAMLSMPLELFHRIVAAFPVSAQRRFLGKTLSYVSLWVFRRQTQNLLRLVELCLF